MITLDQLKAWSIRNIPPILQAPFRTTYHRHNSTFFADGFATIHHVEFLHDQNFLKAYAEAFGGLPSRFDRWRDEYTLAWRAHIYLWAALRASKVNGVFVECGVWYGILAAFLCRYFNEPDAGKPFYLFDTFGKMLGSHSDPNYQEDIWEVVVSRFKDFKNVNLVRGLLPGTLSELPPDASVAFLSIDVNSNDLEVEILKSLWERIPQGGVVYFDDYGWPYPGLRSSVNEFLLVHKQDLLHFPSGNSILIKS